MKDKKKTFILTICLTLCMCAIVILIVLINSLYPDSRGLEYKINADNTTCTITGLGTYSSKDLVIPDTIGDYEVTAIADYAFQGTDIETFSGGKNLTRIGMDAFHNCSELKKVDLPIGITEIGYGAFDLCVRMTEINIPNTVKTIGGNAFCACTSLKSIIIPDSVTCIESGAFGYCVSLTSICFPASIRSVGEGLVGNNSLTTIDVDTNSPVLSSIDGNLYANFSRVFISYACAKPDSSFDIPKTVVRIGTLSFAGCLNLKTISIPKTVDSIGTGIFFMSPNIETIYYDGTVEDWRRIDKEADWNANTESIFTIICTDGTIAMDGTVTYN